jgi:hypothetical protein
MLLLSIAAVALLVGALALTVFDAPLWAAVLLVPGVFLGLALLGFLFVLYLCKRVDQSVPQEEDDKLYRIGLQEFHYKNVEEFFSVPLSALQKNGKIRKLSTSCRDILDEYLSEKQNLDSAVCGRLVIE